MNRDAMPASTIQDDRLGIVRAHDYDRYISALLAPREWRMDLMLLYAFDAEMARIPLTVTEPMLGEIRLQWWRDALSPLLTVADRAPPTSAARTGHPLADGLLDLARRHALPAGLIHGLIDARSADLADAPLRDDSELRSYIAKTDAAVLALSVHLLTSTPPENIDTLIGAVGRAVGLLRLARHISAGDRRAEMLVPLTVWPLDDRHTHAGDEFANARFESARTHAILQLTKLATEEVERSRRELSRLPLALRPAFLPMALVPRYATHLQKIAANPALAGHDINPLSRLWTLWRARRRSIFLARQIPSEPTDA